MLSNVKARILQEVAKERDKYVTKNEPSNKNSDEFIQATAACVGFISEVSHYRKEKKTGKPPALAHDASLPSSTEPPAPSQAQEDGPFKSAPLTKDLAAAFLSRHSLSLRPPQSSSILTTPVLVPQRRPNTRVRGFMPAYAPTLSSFGIAQTAFLDFIITLNASLEPNPYLNAINLAGFAGQASPEPISSLLIGVGVEVVIDAIMKAQS